jgi:hypothetical protein
MGHYLEYLPDGSPLLSQNKADQLLSIPQARQIFPPPKTWEENLVCVVENGPFDAAGYVFNQRELEAFSYPDSRRKTWLHVPDAAALTLHGRTTPKSDWNFNE